jgi:16S rRNA (cytosine967-C5)-methyltransferase
MAARTAAVTTARGCALAVVRRVFEHGAYADRALTAEAVSLDARDRALATALAYGTVQRRATLDYVAERLTNRSIKRLDPPVRAALELGLYQLLFLDRVPVHAAVNETVGLVEGRGAGLVNAVLRRADREGRGLIAALTDDSAAAAALKHSVPVWLAELWWRELGAAEARKLLSAINEPAEHALRVNTLVSSVSAVLDELPVAARSAPDLPEALIVEGAFDAHGSSLFECGAIMPQSRASMLVARMLDPQPGERVLDLCAAPGAKTTHLAALGAQVLAVERHPGRAQALKRTCERMQAAAVSVEVADATLPRTEQFDRVLVDPPCSGLGTLQSRPDLRWRATPEAIEELARLQARILAAGAAATSPGGTLVYSVCTISQAESAGVLDAFLAEHDDFTVNHTRRLLPHTDGTDGFFIARLRRWSGASRTLST